MSPIQKEKQGHATGCQSESAESGWPAAHFASGVRVPVLQSAQATDLVFEGCSRPRRNDCFFCNLCAFFALWAD
jgi:hypothetical protein